MEKRILRNFAIAGLYFAVMNAHAMENGFYMGLMMGPSTSNAPSLMATKRYASDPLGGTCTSGSTSPGCPTPDPFATQPPGSTIANPRANIFATRIYIGNQFNPYAAFELGGQVYSNIRYNTRGVPVYGGTEQRIRDVDLVLKGMFPYRIFTIFGKAGIAATYITSGGSFNPSFTPATQNPPGTATATAKLSVSTTYKKKFAPTYTIGASYDINQSWQVDATYNTLQVGNNIGTLTFYALGLSYHFTDKFCGQFLCDD